MKKYLLFICLFTFLYSQEDYYKITYTGESADVQIFKKDKSDRAYGNIYFPLASDGDLGVIFKSEKSREKFLNFMNSSYDKFKEWESTAIKNDVRDFNKEINKEIIGDTFYFHYGSWQFNYSGIQLKTAIRINEEGNAFFILTIPSKASGSNQYIKSDANAEVINDLGMEEIRSALSNDVINRVLSEKEDLDSLFQ